MALSARSEAGASGRAIREPLAGDSRHSARPRDLMRMASFVVIAALNAFLLWHFHDRYWYPTDDGLHAHIASRLLDGEVFGRDVQDIHPGYAHFVNAGAMWLFGHDLVSLRYPLIAAAFIQACLTYLLLARTSVVAAAAASVAVTALGLLQFMSTTANWYCLSLATGLACWLTWLPKDQPLRLPGAGVIVGILTMFRQLTGVWMAMAVFCVVFLESSQPQAASRFRLKNAIVLIMLVATLGYVVFSPESNLGGFALFAAWPLAILLVAFFKAPVDDRDVLNIVVRLGFGVGVGVLPMVVYGLFNGSFTRWLEDITVVAVGHTQLHFFGRGWYELLPIVAAYQVISSGDPVRIINGLYWLAIPLIAAINGFLLVARVRRMDLEGVELPIIASFYALVSLYLQGPLYLYYTVGLSLVSLLWLQRRETPRRLLSVCAVALSAVAIAYHAGQSRHRNPLEILTGERDTDVWAQKSAGLPGASVQMDAADRDGYRRLVSTIQRHAGPDESILVLPNNAELYFLSGRRNPTRFYNSTMGLYTDSDLAGLLEVIAASPPQVVIVRLDDKFITEPVHRIMAAVAGTHEQVAVIDGAGVYTFRGAESGR